MRVLFLGASICALSFLTSCATYSEGAVQDITFRTPGAVGTLCIVDSGGVIYKAYPPQTMKIQKSNHPLRIHCKASEGRDRTVVVPPQVNSAAAMNISNGFLPGLFTDYYTKSMYYYPSIIALDFTKEEHMEHPRPLQELQDIVPPPDHELEHKGTGLPPGPPPYIPPLERRQSLADIEARERMTPLVIGAQGSGDYFGPQKSEPVVPKNTKNMTADELNRAMNP